MKFSDRIGITSSKKPFQKDSIDEDLRNGLWNSINLFLFDSTFDFTFLTNMLWIHFFKRPIDDVPTYTNTGNIIKEKTINEIRDWFFSAKWYQLYNLIDFLLNLDLDINKKEFKKFLNLILERENSAYRIIDGSLAPITNTLEIEAIEKATSTKGYTSLNEVNIHLQNALDKLSDKKNPDYRNSIKESISAVESLVNKINSSEKDSLGTALNKIDSSVNIHSSLKTGFRKIYGYTSDSDGIRHSLTEKPNCSFEDAKYMLVSCSTFINYLIEKADKASINL